MPCPPAAPADANSIAQQALGNIRTVYAFNGEERTLEAYSASLQPPLKVCLNGNHVPCPLHGAVLHFQAACCAMLPFCCTR